MDIADIRTPEDFENMAPGTVVLAIEERTPLHHLTTFLYLDKEDIANIVQLSKTHEENK